MSLSKSRTTPLWTGLLVLSHPLFLLSEQQSEPPSPSKPVQALIDRITRLAVSEPIEFGIDTRARVAEALAPKFPTIAIRQLRDAEASLTGVPEGQPRNRVRTRLVGQFALLDFDEAERLAKTIAPERKDDYLSQAYDLLYSNPGKRDRDDLIRDALAAGAFRLKCAATRLAELKASAPDRALALFAAISNAFPDPPDKQDLAYLQSRIAEMSGVENEIILAATRKTKPETAADPKTKPDERHGLLAHLSARPTPRPDFSKAQYSDALEQISRLADPLDRASNLIDLSRRTDLTPAQQARVASEALSALGQMKISDDRLMGLSMLSRDFVKRHEYASAALAAQMLVETYNKACGCGAGTCKVDDSVFDCVDLVNGYAEYLDELKIKQDTLGLQNISLEARLLIYQLHNLLGK